MQDSNQQNQVSNGNAQAAVPKNSLPSSSPWEDDLDLPEENKNTPTIIGSLGPVDVPNIKTLKVPGEIDEKVGKELNVNDVVGPKQISTPSISGEKKETNIAADIKPQPSNNLAVNTTKTEALTPPIEKKPFESIQPPANTVNKTPNSDLDEIDWFGGDQPAAPVNQPVTGVNEEVGGVSGLVKPIDIKPVDMVKPAESEAVIDSPTGTEGINDLIDGDGTLEQAHGINSESSSQVASAEKTDIEKGKIQTAKNKLMNLNIGKIVLSSFGSILIVLIIIIALNEMGMFSLGFDKVYGRIGLEKIWGGLSSNPEAALVQSIARMEAKPDFKVKGAIDLKVDSTIKNEVSDPLIVEDYGIEEMTSTLLFQNSQNVSQAEIKLSNSAGESTLLIQNKDDKLYVKGDEQVSYAVEPGMWAEFVIGALSGKTFQNEFYKIKNDIRISGERIGVEKVEGKNCYHYRLKNINIGNGLENVGITSDMVQSMEGDIWIGIKDKLVAKVALRITTPVSTAFSMIEANLTFYDYGVVNNIEAVSESFVERADQRKDETGDVKRKSDVAKIIEALEEYKAENGLFPNSNNQLVPLNGADNLVATALVPKYIKELPKDENELFNWYYAYKSDGQKCSVSARLANSADPEAQLTGNLVLYIKYNSD